MITVEVTPQGCFVDTASVSSLLERCKTDKFHLPIQPIKPVDSPTLSGQKLKSVSELNTR
jgi:hypothetical protein